MRCTNCGSENPDNMTFCGACAARLGFSPDVEAAKLTLSADFVGRHQELRNLVSALEDAIAGRGHLVMLVGDPGIGKTRTAQELSAIAEQKRALIVWGRCYEGEGAPPYWPWLQVLGEYIQQEDIGTLRSVLGAGASSIAELMPELRERLPETQPSSPHETAEESRFRLFNAITAFLRNASSNQPIVVVLDDLHWADRSSLLLLEFLCQRLDNSRLLIIGTYRDMELSRSHPLAQSLGALTRESVFQRISLRGLTRVDVGRYIEHLSRRYSTPELADTVFRHSEGNLLFVRELAEFLIHEENDWSGRIPEGIREVIGRRLDRLSQECNDTLHIASVIGREFGLQLLEMMIEKSSEDQLLDVLDEAANIGVIEESPNAVGLYRFTHALIQETIADELSLTRRARLHARIAEGLEKLYGNEPSEYSSELAYHFAQAETVLGSEKLVKYSLIAGEKAIDASAFEEARIHFERALTAKEGSSSSGDLGQDADATTATILFGLGRAQLATSTRSQAQEAVDNFRRAFDAFVNLGNTEEAVAVAMYPHGFLRSSSGMADMTSRALDLVEPDSLQGGHLLARYGSALSWEYQDYEGALQNLEQAVKIARQREDRALEIHALVLITQVNYDQGRFRDAIEISGHIVKLAQSLNELETVVHARIMSANAFLSIGDAEKSQMHATAGLEAATRLHNSAMLVALLRHNAYLAALKGEWDVAHELLSQALVESPNDVAALADRAWLYLQVGDIEESRIYIKRVLEFVSVGLVVAGFEQAIAAMTLPLFARVSGTSELLDAAESTARSVVSSPSQPGLFINRARIGLALVAIQRGDAGAAEAQYEILKSWRSTQVFSLFCYDRLLGLLSQTIGNVDDAQGHFEDALGFCRRAGYRAELAWSLYDYAEFALGQKQNEITSSLLEEALSISTDLKMLPVMDKVVALKENAESQLPSASAYPDGLTDREVEVLRLVASGRSNPEIAEELFISPRTVTTHVSNILNKTNSANRAEASTYASQNGLI